MHVDREEGIIPYMPEIVVQTDAIINYNKSVANVRAIYTAPAGLESTSLVFVYGLGELEPIVIGVKVKKIVITVKSAYENHVGIGPFDS